MENGIIEILKEFEKMAHLAAIGFPDPNYEEFARRIKVMLTSGDRISEIFDRHCLYKDSIGDYIHFSQLLAIIKEL